MLAEEIRKKKKRLRQNQIIFKQLPLISSKLSNPRFNSAFLANDSVKRRKSPICFGVREFPSKTHYVGTVIDRIITKKNDSVQKRDTQNI